MIEKDYTLTVSTNNKNIAEFLKRILISGAESPAVKKEKNSYVSTVEIREIEVTSESI